MRLALVLLASLLVHPAVPAQPFDYLVTNCRILDGTGNPWFRADVGIREGRIAVIGNLSGRDAQQTLDGRDRILAPGFIDVHTHVEDTIERHPRADNFLLDGVTTVVTGNCGTSRIDLDSWFAELQGLGLGDQRCHFGWTQFRP